MLRLAALRPLARSANLAPAPKHLFATSAQATAKAAYTLTPVKRLRGDTGKRALDQTALKKALKMSSQPENSEQLAESSSKRARTDGAPSTNGASGPAHKKQKMGQHKGKGKGKWKGKKSGKRGDTSATDTMDHAIRELLGDDLVQKAASLDDLPQPPEPSEGGWDLTLGNTIECTIHAMSSFGDGLAVSPQKDWVVVVPFTVPGDRVKARLYRHEMLNSKADLLEVVEKGPWRDDSLVQCKYFGKCSGCQYQMVSYDKQLELKRTVIEKAFKYMSGLKPADIPAIGDTLPSPLEYRYRTKLTPHFNPGPRNRDTGPDKETTVPIGFEEKGRSRVMDIEECPLATDVINTKLTEERRRVHDTIDTFKRGATLLLRDSAKLSLSADGTSNTPSEEPHTCVTDHKETVVERVGDLVFQQPAGSFFQNNNSILPSLVAYIADRVVDPDASPDRYLVDAYCGSGLFGISLANRFKEVAGVEISAPSILWANRNMKTNGISNCRFIAGNAENIFTDLTFPPAETTVLIDPPRKGCDELFLKQLIAFGPSSIAYISCNVHTQARDIGILVRDAGYVIESIRGADLFPQSHHAESVAVLRRDKPPADVGTSTA